jgi:hypothetical protein
MSIAFETKRLLAENRSVWRAVDSPSAHFSFGEPLLERVEHKKVCRMTQWSGTRTRNDNATIARMLRRGVVERREKARARHRDVGTPGPVWDSPVRVFVRGAPRVGLLAFAVVSCQVYDPSLLPPETTSEAGSYRDADRDAQANADARPGSADGADRNDAGGAGGRDGAGGGSGGGGGTGGQDAGSSGAGGQDASRDGALADSADTGGRGGGDGGNVADANDSGGTVVDSASDCSAGSAACSDATADAPDGIVDQCPNDPLKTVPGSCGCGTPDKDTDVDGTADCIDGCPGDVRKTQAGICGCNADDPSDADAGIAFCLKALLAHRYSFNGTGTVATDSIAGANGSIMGGSNATLSGGSVSLTGDLGTRYTTEGFVQLPSNLVSPLANLTLEAWVTWRGVGTTGSRFWQRIIDFGDQVASGSDLIGHTYLFVTPQATSSAASFRVAFSANGSANETLVNAATAFPLNAQAHLAVVADDAGDTLTIYLNGNPEGSVAWTGTIASITNTNSWLGRSNYNTDPELNGVLHEFRIFRVALSAAQVRASYLAGPDPSYF